MKRSVASRKVTSLKNVWLSYQCHEQGGFVQGKEGGITGPGHPSPSAAVPRWMSPSAILFHPSDCNGTLSTGGTSETEQLMSHTVSQVIAMLLPNFS